MKFIAHFSRIFVGVIFIFSGLIKLNDPVGTEIKLEEYFDVFATDFPTMAGFWHFWVPYALYVSIFLCALELVLGVCLLVQYKLKTASWILLATVIFFGFLTFYSAYFDKVTDCGCFGETIKLKPWTSFIKDMVLLFFILIILWQRTIFSDKKTGIWVIAATVFCLFLGIYAVKYLPPHDGLPYAIGQDIPKNMKPSEALKFKYIYEKDGKTLELEQMPTDTTYKFKEMITLNQDEAKAKITDYNLWKDGDSTDYKAESFVGQKLMVVIPVIKKANVTNLDKIKALAKSLEGSAITVWLVSGSSEEDVNNFRHEHQLAFPNLSADTKVLKTIARTNPVIWLLDNGIVKGKWSQASVPTKEEVQASLQK
jgi:uncharacterized membrane protein YphA (DoxX/SURF4 family)/peroxiredoxin